MDHQNQDTNRPGQAGNSVLLEGAPAATSPPEPGEQVEIVGQTAPNLQIENVGRTPADPQVENVSGIPPDLQAEGFSGMPLDAQSENAGGTLDAPMDDVDGIPQIRNRAATKQKQSRIDQIMKKRKNKSALSGMADNKNLRSVNYQGQNGHGNVSASGTTREVKSESPEEIDGVAGQPPLSNSNNRVTNPPSVEPYDPQRDPNYSKFGVPIDTFSVNRHDQGEFMYWLNYRRERYYVVKIGSNEAPKYRIVWEADWCGEKPDIRPDNCVSHSQFAELNRLNELGQHIYTWKDVTAVRGVAWIDKNGEGLEGIDPRRKIWCSWSVTAPEDEKPVHQRLQIRNRSNGRRAGTFNYTLILCEVQKKGSEERVECIINRNTYRSILRAGKAAADITLFIHADYAEKRHNGQIDRKSPSPSRNFEGYLRQCSVAPDSWQETRQRKSYYDGDDDDEDEDDVEDGEETDEESDTSEESGYESDSYSDLPQRSPDRGTHRTRFNRKESAKHERGNRKREKNQLDEILTMLKDLSGRVRQLERREKKSKKGRRRD